MAVTKNQDIVGLVRRANRFTTELIKSQSGGVTGVQTDDLTRLKSYSAALTAYKTWVVSQPELDMPVSHPTEHPLGDFPDFGEVKSDSLYDVITMLGKLREELIGCNSSNLGSGLTDPDAKRFDKIMEKVNAFVTDYIEHTDPLDAPETSKPSN